MKNLLFLILFLTFLCQNLRAQDPCVPVCDYTICWDRLECKDAAGNIIGLNSMISGVNVILPDGTPILFDQSYNTSNGCTNCFFDFPYCDWAATCGGFAGLTTDFVEDFNNWLTANGYLGTVSAQTNLPPNICRGPMWFILGTDVQFVSFLVEEANPAGGCYQQGTFENFLNQDNCQTPGCDYDLCLNKKLDNNCSYPIADILAVKGGIPINLNTEPGFTFPYNVDGPAANLVTLVANLNNWLAGDGTAVINEDCSESCTPVYSFDWESCTNLTIPDIGMPALSINPDVQCDNGLLYASPPSSSQGIDLVLNTSMVTSNFCVEIDLVRTEEYASLFMSDGIDLGFSKGNLYLNILGFNFGNIVFLPKDLSSTIYLRRSGSNIYMEINGIEVTYNFSSFNVTSSVSPIGTNSTVGRIMDGIGEPTLDKFVLSNYRFNTGIQLQILNTCVEFDFLQIDNSNNSCNSNYQITFNNSCKPPGAPVDNSNPPSFRATIPSEIHIKHANPVTGILDVQFKNNHEQELDLEIYSMMGQKIEQNKIPAGQNNYEIYLEAGTYILIVRNDKTVIYNEKIISVNR